MQSGVGIVSIEQSEDLSEALLVLRLATSHLNGTYSPSVRSARHLARSLGGCPSRIIESWICSWLHICPPDNPLNRILFTGGIEGGNLAYMRILGSNPVASVDAGGDEGSAASPPSCL